MICSQWYPIHWIGRMNSSRNILTLCAVLMCLNSLVPSTRAQLLYKLALAYRGICVSGKNSTGLYAGVNLVLENGEMEYLGQTEMSSNPVDGSWKKDFYFGAQNDVKTIQVFLWEQKGARHGGDFKLGQIEIPVGQINNQFPLAVANGTKLAICPGQVQNKGTPPKLFVKLIPL